MSELRADHPFSITHGGPCYRVLSSLHLVDRRGDVRWERFALALWAMTTTASLLPLALHGRVDPTLVDLSVHARFLIALPLAFIAERLLERRCKVAMRQLRAGRFASRADLDAIVDRAEHLRDSRLVEGLLLAVALLGSQAALWGWVSPETFVHGMERSELLSIARLWYAAIALPVVQFLFLRWLWRWALWAYVLVRLSRLRLALNALHPDGAAGIGFLAEPIDAFAVFLASVASVASAAWTEKVLLGQAVMQTFAPAFVGFLVLALVLALGPMLLFCGHVYRARQRDLPLHADLALHYVRDFKQRWMSPPRTGFALDTPDVSALCDLGGGFKTTAGTRIAPLGLRSVLVVVAAVLLPMVPLLLSSMPVNEIVDHLGKALLGGLPI